jgi:hypothetical protein
MAIYPALFGHVELPDVTDKRRDRNAERAIGVRFVRPVDPARDHRPQHARSGS